MKKSFLWILALLCFYPNAEVLSQPCDDDGIRNLMYQVKGNIHFVRGKKVNVPGETITAKSTYALDVFKDYNKMSNEENYTFLMGPHRTNAVSHFQFAWQMYNDKPIHTRYIIFRYDFDGNLVSTNIRLIPSFTEFNVSEEAQNKQTKTALLEELELRLGDYKINVWNTFYKESKNALVLYSEGEVVKVKTGEVFNVNHNSRDNKLELVSLTKKEALGNNDYEGNEAILANSELWISYPTHDSSGPKVLENTDSHTFINSSSTMANGYRLAGTYANSNQTFYNGTPGINVFDFPVEISCSEPDPVFEDWKYENTMAYFHLNRFFDSLNSFVGASGAALPDVPTTTVFKVDGNTSPTYSVSISGAVNIEFGANCNSAGWEDLAEDAHFIVEAAFEYYWNLEGNVPSGADGVLFGTLDYIAQSYMTSINHPSPSVISWGGNDETRFTDLNETYDDVNNFTTDKEKGQIWGSTLMEIHDAVGLTITNNILFNTMDNTGGGGNDQQSMANSYYDTAVLFEEEGSITLSQLCQIATILQERYPEQDFGVSDYYIKDSQAGQGINGDDIGEEPNNATQQFWVSPSIWNCVSDGTCTSYEEPKYDDGASNYIRVRVHNAGCADEDIEGKIEVYAAAAATGHTWPNDWIDHEECDPANPSYCVIVGDLVGTADLESGYEVDGDSRIYTVPWVPFNPYKFWALPQFEENDKIHVCLMAMIVSDDPEDEPFGMPSNRGNKKENNNTAMRNMSIQWISGVNIVSDDPSVLIVRRPQKAIYDHGNPQPVDIRMQVDEDFGGVVDWTDFTTRGEVEIRLPTNLLDVWRVDGYPGQDYAWVNDNVIKVTGPNFEMTGLQLLENEDYVIAVRWEPTLNFKPVAFELEMFDSNGCATGGERYQIEFAPVQAEAKKNVESQNRSEWIVEDTNISVYPNPASLNSQLKIELGKFEGQVEKIRLKDINGQIFKEISNFDGSDTTINLERISMGAYYLEVQLNDGKFLYKQIAVVK